MAIRQGGVTVIDDSRNIVNANTVMLNGDFTPYANEGPNILWSAAGSLVSTFDNPNAYDTSLNDNFGYAVAVDGKYAIVGAYAEEDRYGSISGKAYIYNVVTGSLISTLNNPNPFSNSNSDEFAYSVGISGNFAIVGAQSEDDAGGGNSGKAYIFNVTTGALLWTLNNPNAYSTSIGDRFASSVAISGNFAIVGAYQESDSSGLYSGKAYVYNAVTGALLWTLNNPNAYNNGSNTDYFGQSVAISGNFAIVGAPQENDAAGATSGKAYIFNATTGALVWTLNNPNAYGTSASDLFGGSVAISGNFAIVGAYWEDDAGGTESGKAYIFNVTTGALAQTLNNPNAYGTSATDLFGTSVAISGNFAIVGAQNEDEATGTESGKAYIFNATTGALVWTLNNPNAYDTSLNDYFARAIGISDNYAIVGAYLEDDAGGSGSGKAYTFALNTTYRTGKPITTASDFGYVRKNAAGSLVWTLNNPDTYVGLTTADYFGQSVAISGNFAIVGAYLEDEPGSGNNESGKAYIFNVTTGQLVHTLNNPNAYGTVQSDYFGISVDIHGRYAVVGASNEETSGGNGLGVVYIFDVYTGSLVTTIQNLNALYDSFGRVVAINGNYVAIGANSGGNEGIAFIYNLSGNLIWTLNNPNSYSIGAGDFFATSMSISDRHLIIGAKEESNPSGTGSGAAYVFNLSTGTLLWTFTNPTPYGTGQSDNFGESVAISGNYAIVGAPSEDPVSFNEGLVYIYNVTTGSLVRTLYDPVPTGVSAFFGSSVRISEKYVIVAANNKLISGFGGAGRVYVFNVDTGTLVYTFDNPNAYSTPSGDQFGSSVAISGNYVIVGASKEDSSVAVDTGKAYIFSVNDTYRLTNVEEIQLANGMKISADNKLLQQSVPAGALIHTLDNPNAYSTSEYDFFGYSVAISGNYVVVGASSEDDPADRDSGKVYVFNAITGQLLYTLNNPNAYSTVRDDQFGYSVAISDKYIIVGAYYESDAAGIYSGKAYIFDVITGTLLWTLNNPNAYSTSFDDQFGTSVAISDNYAIVGAPREDDLGGTFSGKAYIFDVRTGALVWTLDNPNAYGTSGSDSFGQSVAISGNYVVVGAYYENATGLGSGVAYVYDVLRGTLLRTFIGVNNSFFGISTSMSGKYAIFGAPAEFNSSGSATIYDVGTGALVLKITDPNAYSTNDSDNFGGSVAISGDYAIVGAYIEDDAGGTGSGKAYIYNVRTGQLIQTLHNPNAYSTSLNDNFGQAVAISGDYAIANARLEDDAAGISSGKAYIFSVRDLTYLDRLVQMVS